MTTFTNQATLSYQNFITTSNIVRGEIQATLSMTKNAVNQSYRAGDTITYSVSLVNNGSTPFNDITLADNLGAYAFDTATRTPLTYVEGSIAYYRNGEIQTAPTVSEQSPLTITGINIPARSNVLILYAATVNNYAPQTQQASITNTVTATGGGLLTPLSASATVSANTAANLYIVKALNPTTVVDNEAITYTFTIQNTGADAATAADQIVLSDTFAPPLALQSVTLNGSELPATDYTYAQTSGLFTTRPGAITVPGATYTQDSVTGIYSIVPGTTVLTVTGTI